MTIIQVHSTDLVRIILFFGLFIHKLVWEVLKRKYAARRNIKDIPLPRKRFARIVKFIKVLVLLGFVTQTLFLDILPISNGPPGLTAFGMFIFFVGLAVSIAGRLRIGENWVDLEEYQMLPGQSLVTDGVYGYIRHPIYTGDFLLVLGLELALQSWLFLATALLIPIVRSQVRAEEALLLGAFPEYNEYSHRTKRFIPLIL